MKELIDLVTSQLGVNSDQAEGGVGLMLNAAKSKLGGEFSQITDAIPGLDGLISKGASLASEETEAPKAAGGLMGMISNLTGGKGKLGQLAAMASLAGGFKKLGLDAGMVTKFAPVVMGFMKTKGGDTVKNLMEKALK